MRDGRRSFFDRTDWLAFWVSTVIALSVYLCSLGPSVGLEDAGELAVAADVLGVPHPPGYPLWTILSWGLCRLFSWVTWQGYPNPAWAVSLGSAIAGALATGVTAMLISCSLRLMRSGERRAESGERRCSRSGETAVANEGDVSVGADVPALAGTNSKMRPSKRYSATGKTSSSMEYTPTDKASLTDDTPTNKVSSPMTGVSPDAPASLRSPLSALRSSISAFRIPNSEFLCGVVGSLVFAFSPVMWSQAVIVEVYALGALFMALTMLLAYRWMMQPTRGNLVWLGFVFGLGLTNYQVLLLGALPLGWMVLSRALRERGNSEFGMRNAECAGASGDTPSIEERVLSVEASTRKRFLTKRRPTQARANSEFRIPNSEFLRSAGWAFLAMMAGLSVYGYLPLVSDLLNPPMNWGYARTWEGFTRLISRGQYEALEPSLFFSVTYWQQLYAYVVDLLVQFSLPVVLVAVVGTGIMVRRVVKAKDRLGKLWFTVTLGFFLVMSAVLIALANPSGDIQDGFIQKVKFISSHGIFALWIGYGLFVLLQRFPRMWVIAVFVPLIPIVMNFTDDRLIATMGAAEQTGHDYGWQFGAYMLNGAPTINAELSPDEEPLPDPFYPPPMEQNAIFFGGTDPGRFVPTYMVYSADFRSDISVFTQNALADPTYMNVQRDLYGNTLWVPTADEVLNAFSDYVAAVQRGERTTRGKIIEKGGRVQITGPAAIMEINAELAHRLYTMNADRTFYIEESYPMPWMTKFLAPAGLAMKIGREESNLEATLVQDGDFWDWMARRLVSESGYRRDFAAQKSFSKLRCSIGRLYSKRRLEHAKDVALREAVMLYPLSPEAILHYIQEELLMPAEQDERGKIGSRFRVYDAYRMVKRYLAQDPKNTMAQRLMARIKPLVEAQEVVDRVYATLESTTTAEICKMALACEVLREYEYAEGLWMLIEKNARDLTSEEAWSGCIALQRMEKDAGVAMKFLRRVSDATVQKASVGELLACANLCQERADPMRAWQLLKLAHEKAPTSAEVWVALALFFSNNGDGARAYEAFERAIKFGAWAILQKDRAVAEVYLRLDERYGPKKGAQQ